MLILNTRSILWVTAALFKQRNCFDCQASLVALLCRILLAWESVVYDSTIQNTVPLPHPPPISRTHRCLPRSHGSHVGMQHTHTLAYLVLTTYNSTNNSEFCKTHFKLCLYVKCTNKQKLTKSIIRLQEILSKNISILLTCNYVKKLLCYTCYMYNNGV